jgi:hypothetical protein
MADVERVRQETVAALNEAGIADISLDYIDEAYVGDLAEVDELDSKPVADWEADASHEVLVEEDAEEIRSIGEPEGESAGVMDAQRAADVLANEAPVSRHVRYVWRPAKSGGIWHFYWWKQGRCTAQRGSGAVSTISDSGTTCGETGEKIYKIVWYTR